MSDLPRLTESKIQRWIGEPSFGRGQRYYLLGNILNPRREGETLKALCSGSRSEPYRVEMLLGSQDIIAGNCSCPVGGGGHCKHASALLLTWMHEPDTFQDIEDLEAELGRRNKAELTALILKMIQRYPDLEVLVELPTAGGPEASGPIDPELIRRQVKVAFSGAGHEWRTASRASVDLQDVVDLGDEYAEHQHWHNAAIVYETVARRVLGHHEMVHEEEDLNYIVYQCTEGLAQCLEAADDSAQRQGLLRALFDVYRWDVDSGGYGMGEDVPEEILALASREERRRVSEWVRKAMPGGDSRSDDYRRRAYGGFLLELLETELDDESFLQVCRQTGLQHDLVDRLLTLNRVDEAVVEAKSAGDYDLLRLADLFALYGQADLGEQIIRERAETSKGSRLTNWLKAKAEERGDIAEASALAEALLWQQLSAPAYEEMGKLAQRLKRWDSVRAECLSRLQDKGNFSFLTEIYLLEGDVDLALQTIEQFQHRSPWGSRALSLRVAQAPKRADPATPYGSTCQKWRSSLQLVGEATMPRPPPTCSAYAWCLNRWVRRRPGRRSLPVSGRRTAACPRCRRNSTGLDCEPL